MTFRELIGQLRQTVPKRSMPKSSRCRSWCNGFTPHAKDYPPLASVRHLLQFFAIPENFTFRGARCRRAAKDLGRIRRAASLLPTPPAGRSVRLAVRLGERGNAFCGGGLHIPHPVVQGATVDTVTDYSALVERLTANPDTRLGGYAIPVGSASTSNRDVAAPTDQFRKRNVTGISVQSNDQVSLEKAPLTASPSSGNWV